MDYITTQEAAQRWNISARSVARYVKDGKIPGAIMLGKSWLIPINTIRPDDRRYIQNRSDLHKKDDKQDKFKFPIYYYLANCKTRTDFTPMEALLRDIQVLLLEGKLKEAFNNLKKLLPIIEHEPTYFKVGVLYTAVLVAFEYSKIKEMCSYIDTLDILLQKDFPYKKEMELFYPVVKYYVYGFYDIKSFQVDSDYVYHKDVLPLIYCLYVFRYTISYTSDRMQSHDIAMINCILNIMEAEGNNIAACILHSAMMCLCGGVRDVDGFYKHARKFIGMAVESKCLGLLFDSSQYLGKVFNEILVEYGEEVVLRTHQLTHNHLKAMMALAEYKGSISVFSLYTEEEINILCALAANCSNEEIAHLMGMSVSSISKRLKLIYEKAGVDGRKAIKEYAINICNSFYR